MSWLATLASTTAHSFTDTSASNGVDYSYTVRSVSDGGTSRDSLAVVAHPFRELCVADSLRNQILVFNAEKPITHEKGTTLTFHLKQDHGGWNSDDLMTNNLGRLRLSVTSSPSGSSCGRSPAGRRSPTAKR